MSSRSSSGRKVSPELGLSSGADDINELLKLTTEHAGRGAADAVKQERVDRTEESQFQMKVEAIHQMKDTISEVSDSESELSASKTGLTQNQNRLLYLLSLYTQTAKNNTQKERWIRKQALLIFLYEGIVLKLFDFDYAPYSQMIEHQRVYFNISQEGISDVDFLREEGFVNSLTLTTETFTTTKCFQISEKGEVLLNLITRRDKEAVHEIVYAPGTRNLLQVKWTPAEQCFVLEESLEARSEETSSTASLEVVKRVYSRKSTVLECEEMSYVSSAYIPQCLRGKGRPTYSNAHRSHECSQGAVQIKDELDEVITLNSVSIFVSEYVPVGPNTMVSINKNLSSDERVSGGFFTPQKDLAPLETSLEVSPGLTNISVLDYESSEFINIEADIYFPVQQGTVQVEAFGVSINQTGAIFCGMQVEAVSEKIRDNLSLDHLARLLVDVQTDSSQILDSIISDHQRQLLDFMFNEVRASREKMSIMVANEIMPQLCADEYLDKGDYENELRQIVGEIRGGYDVSEYDVLFFGSSGLLLAGPSCRQHEILLCAYLQLRALDLFLQSFHSRLFFLIEEIKQLRSIISEADKDPESGVKIRSKLGKTTEYFALLEEILGYLKESVSMIALPKAPGDEAGRNLYQYLELDYQKRQIEWRVSDLVKNVNSSRTHLDILKESATILRQQKLLSVEENLKHDLDAKLTKLNLISDRTCHVLHCLLYISSALLAFALLDRLTGTWTVVNASWMHTFAELVILETPFLWFLLSLSFSVAVIFFVVKAFRKQLYLSEGVLTIEIIENRRIDLGNLSSLLQRKQQLIVAEQKQFVGHKVLSQVTWVESETKDWGYVAPKVTLSYDEKNCVLFSVFVSYHRRQAKKALAFSAQELKDRVRLELDAANLWHSAEEAQQEQGKSRNKKAR